MKKSRIEDYLENPKHKAVLKIIREPKKCSGLNQIGKALVWIGPAIACFVLGITTGKTAYFITSFAILMVFALMHVMVHADLMKSMSEIIEDIEKHLKQQNPQQQPSSEHPSSDRIG